jgi:ADP-heptose:LPS heptosyltransferase
MAICVGRMKKLILKCNLAVGDIVMLTAAVRDLHRDHPGRFVTDVWTRCGDLWLNNPFITPLSDNDPEAQLIECSYPLINRCDKVPYHCLHGFIDFLNQTLGLRIGPSLFKGDIHLSEQEKVWYSQVREVTEMDIPFWIIAAGGKYDVTIKWWDSKRYQEIVDYFRGRVQFVQVGQIGHHHPKLTGVIDLRGKTTLRELIRLVYHSQGVLCSVTSLMHLAAAVPTKPGAPTNRPCVVIAGGREPAHWEAYPDHQFIHTNGALACCAAGGCWKDRTARLRDGDTRDRKDNRCVDVVRGLPHCMSMITSAEVARRIELYFNGGALKYLTPKERSAGERGICATANNEYELQPLTLHNAGMACEGFINSIPKYPDCYSGRGIVICGGGVRYFTNAWVAINRLRKSGCTLPIELWHWGRGEMSSQMKALVAPLSVDCIDACVVSRKHPTRVRRGWALKPYAIKHSRFREVLLLDADNVATVAPEFLFETAQYRATGALFWPDYEQAIKDEAAPVWRSCGLRAPAEPEFESGQVLLDKRRCWKALCLCLWFNEHSTFYYKYLHGDKETFHLAFRKVRKSYSLVPTPVQSLEGTMCQHDFQGRRIFQHRNFDKWDFLPLNRSVTDFWFEGECQGHLARLRRLWDGRIGPLSEKLQRTVKSLWAKGKQFQIQTVVLSTSDGKSEQETFRNLARTDWAQDFPHLHTNLPVTNDDAYLSALRAGLENALKSNPDYVLLLGDKLVFNKHLRHNLESWNPFSSGRLAAASLYNAGVREFAFDLTNNARLVAAPASFGSQAFLLSQDTVLRLLRRWKDFQQIEDFKMATLLRATNGHVLYHAPSLAQLTNSPEPRPLLAVDFDPLWKA